MLHSWATLAIIGLEYSKQFNGNAIKALEEKSLLSASSNKPIARDFVFWEHSANRAIRIGDLKLVSKTGNQKKFGAADENNWELYD